jgi:ribonuclease D
VHPTYGPLEAAIDPFTVDLTPLVELIADENIIKIVHSGSVDLHIIWTAFGKAPANVFDTQIAAAFLGFGHQIGYADLVRRLTGASISKNLQYSDWSVRPLTEEQINYAMSDVLHLPPLHAHLSQELQRRNRFEWALAEFHRAEAKAARNEADENAYKRLNLSGLKRSQLAILREVAAVREEMAREVDRPPGFIVPDLALLQLVRQRPHTISDLRAIRGMPQLPNDQANRLLRALEIGTAVPQDQWPPARPEERPDPRLDTIVTFLGVVAGARATEQDVARAYLSPRDQMATLATWWLRGKTDELPDIDLLSDWRYELLGRDLIRLLDGDVFVVMNHETGLPEMRENVKVV